PSKADRIWAAVGPGRARHAPARAGSGRPAVRSSARAESARVARARDAATAAVERSRGSGKDRASAPTAIAGRRRAAAGTAAGPVAGAAAASPVEAVEAAEAVAAAEAEGGDEGGPPRARDRAGAPGRRARRAGAEELCLPGGRRQRAGRGDPRGRPKSAG